LFRPLNIFSFYLELYKICASWGVRCHVSFKVLIRLSQMIFDVPSHFQESPVWNYFDFLFEDMGYSCTCICINMKKYLFCQTIDYMQMSYDYEYKELSIPFWSTCLSSPLKYFMGVWPFVIVYFQQNKSLLKCTSLWQLLFFILYWYWFVVT
jgi:hypothetical protein